MKNTPRSDGFIERDYRFENLVVWGVDYSQGDYNLSTRGLIDSTSTSDTPSAPVKPKAPVTETPTKLPAQRVKQTYYQSKQVELTKSKSTGEQIEVDTAELIRAFSSNNNLELEKLFPDKNPLGRNAERDLEDEEHKRLLKEQEESYKKDERNKHTYSLKDFPLAEPELINKLAEIHSKYFSILIKLQDTHTPEDFVTAFRIQDRIAYLLDNQTLLYKTLTKKLIKYLERITEKLEKYLKDITLKQEDLKRMNAQISRFNEYDRKTQSRIDQAEKETNLFQQDLQTYQDSLRNLQVDLQAELQTAPESTNGNGTNGLKDLKLEHEVISH